MFFTHLKYHLSHAALSDNICGIEFKNNFVLVLDILIISGAGVIVCPTGDLNIEVG